LLLCEQHANVEISGLRELHKGEELSAFDTDRSTFERFSILRKGTAKGEIQEGCFPMRTLPDVTTERFKVDDGF
jgi:hypothetical protein